MFDNISLAKKLAFGFGTVLLLLTMVGFIAYSSLEGATEGFSEYREMARDTNLSGRVQANMLMVRMNVKDFIITGSDKDKREFEEYWEKTQTFMAEAQQEINDPRRAKSIDDIEAMLVGYHDGFETVVKLTNERNELVIGVADVVGPNIEKALSAILVSAKEDGDMTAAYHASLATRNLLLARIYASKFISTNNPAAFERVKKEFSEMDLELNVLERELENPKRRDLLAEAKQGKAQYLNAFGQIVSAIETRNGVISGTLDKLGPKIAAEVEAVKLDIKGVQDKLGPELKAANNQAVSVIVVLAGIAMLFGVGIAYFVIRSLTGPINKGVAMANEIAKGDFSQRMNMNRTDEIGKLATALDAMCEVLQRAAALAEQIAAGNIAVDVQLASDKDQLGLALQKMTGNLNDILGQIQVSGEQIASGSGQVADSSQSLSQGATEQASSLEEISASLSELASQTSTNAENANQANQLATSAQDAAKQGGKKMESMVTAMGEINDAGQNISKIIKTIDEIAFQTNLLALNAAVEAARAGQHGKGFAVVAEEVRNLAARSAKAAEETSELIEGSVEKTENGSAIANQTAEALQEIFTGISKTSDLVAEIAAASNEQAQGVSQISQGVTQIDQVTQQNTANAEESAAAAEELSGQSESMKQMLGRFVLKDQSTRSNAISWKQTQAAPVSPATDWPSNNPTASISLNDGEFGRF